jgi:hypothetical protein
VICIANQCHVIASSRVNLERDDAVSRNELVSEIMVLYVKGTEIFAMNMLNNAVHILRHKNTSTLDPSGLLASL